MVRGGRMPGRGGRKNMRGGVPKGAIKKGDVKRVLKMVFKGNVGKYVAVFACLIMNAVSGVVASIFLKQITNNCINIGIFEGYDAVKTTLMTYIIVMICIYALGLIASYVSSLIMASLSQKIMKDIRLQMFGKMQTLPIKYFDRNSFGDIMSHYTNDVDALEMFIAQSITSFLSSTCMILFLVGTMVSYSIWLTLVLFVGVIAMFFVTTGIGSKSTVYFRKQQKSLGKVEGYIEELMSGQKVVKVFCHEDEAKEQFNEYNDQLYNDAKTANTLANIMMPIMGNIGNIMYVVTAIVGGVIALAGIPNLTITGIQQISNLEYIGIIIAFLPMCRQFTMNISQLSQQVNSVAMAFAAASRIFELLDETPETDNGYVTLIKGRRNEKDEIVEDANGPLWVWKHPHKAEGTVTYTELKGDIVLDNVDFAYEEGKNVLNDVCIEAKAGEKIAFVGATGAGKTTITNLINRFYDIADGKVRYDGININKIKKADLRHSLGIVLQDTNLFTGTVMDNIRYGRLDATDEECIAAAKLASADSFISRLPEGYNTLLENDGANLSQGQRQLLSIARAAVADAPVMILDEATSSIDTRTEKLVQQGTDKLMEGRTVFVIAHRLSTVQNSDKIIVLDHGRIIEEGNHEELIAKKGQYYELYTGAFELE